jgi:hypothetical protein
MRSLIDKMFDDAEQYITFFTPNGVTLKKKGRKHHRKPRSYGRGYRVFTVADMILRGVR